MVFRDGLKSEVAYFHEDLYLKMTIHLDSYSDRIDVECVGQEASPHLLMKLGIHAHLFRVSLSNTVLFLVVSKS